MRWGGLVLAFFLAFSAVPARAAVNAAELDATLAGINDNEAVIRANLDLIAALDAAPLTENEVQFRHEEARAAAYSRFVAAARVQQAYVWHLSANPEMADKGLVRLPPAEAGVVHSVRALQAIWRLGEYDQYDLARIRVTYGHKANASTPLPQLLAYYQEAGRGYGIDWTYLAAINFVETDFGRVLGPSYAGALGPMQFMPETWAAYGDGGNVMNPRDAIIAAARYLVMHGAPGKMSSAIWYYNHDDDYVEAITRYAMAIRSDPSWLDRLYYWSTSD